MRSLVLTGLSFMLTASVIGNAYYQKKQFYPSVVYITKSNPSMAVMYVQALVFVVLMGKMLRALFFGQLRAAEMEHLIERSWYAVTETCLAFTVFRDDFSPRFVALFTLLLFLKCFHWLAEDRIDYMERSPAISWKFHFRALSLMFVLGLLDILFVRHAFYSTMSKGPSVQLVFGFEYEILLTVVVMTFIKYLLHAIDLQSQNPWDNKAVYLLYSELAMGFIRVILYVAFVFIMIKVHTFPLFAIRPMYLTVRAFQKAAQDVILSRRAIRNMNTLYPDATPEELSSGDNVCIICREEMTSGCKKLPCGHIFHTSCLRSWFQRQQTCPTCRLEVLRMPRPQQQQQQQQQQPQQQQAAQPQQAPNQNGQAGVEQMQNPFQNMPGMFGGMPFQWNGAGAAVPPPPPYMWQPPPQQQQQPQQQTPGAAGQAPTPASSSSSSPTSAAATPTTSQQANTQTGGTASAASTSMPSTQMPPFPGFPPFLPGMMPPVFSYAGFPSPPPSMAGLSDEELRVMEGVERSNIEARIQWLRDIQALLDGAMVLINQYNSVASQINSRHDGTSAPQVVPISTSPSSPHQQQQQASSSTTQVNWWPAGSGARPKYSSTISSTHVTNSSKERSGSLSSPSEKHESSDNVEKEETKGATGSSPKEAEIPKWSDPREEEHTDEMHEVRKRRLQHFSQHHLDSNSSNLDSSNSDKNNSESEEKH
ncbi:E3 ubiquitin-protein ligase synoviolin [Elysia marginata]|uniref:RING-type E3 ubiquitin transferase n=2 Tax=Panpulmonata TaxID=977775 RepID=A0AAV4ENM4_9GAST|nr:E3 ubiquitin-protein ligase synoviolin [Elysia marginata]